MKSDIIYQNSSHLFSQGYLLIVSIIAYVTLKYLYGEPFSMNYNSGKIMFDYINNPMDKLSSYL